MALAIRETFLPEFQDVIQRLDRAMQQERSLAVISPEIDDLKGLALQMEQESLSRQRIREINTLALQILEKANQRIALLHEDNAITKAAIQDSQFLHAKLTESLECEINEKNENEERKIDLQRRELEAKFPGYRVIIRKEMVNDIIVASFDVMY